MVGRADSHSLSQHTHKHTMLLGLSAACMCVCSYLSFDTANLEQTLECDQSSSLSDFPR